MLPARSLISMAGCSDTDSKILALTVWKVMKGEGISQFGQATVEEFRESR